MEVILREDVEKLGSRGQVVKVADGFARNFLLPRRMAVVATLANKKVVEQERQAGLRREAKEAEDARDLGRLLEPVVLTMVRKAGEQDQLFGSVTSGDIAEALAAQDFNIDRKKIQLDESIRQVGEYQVPIRLHREVTVSVTVKVEREEQPEA